MNSQIKVKEENSMEELNPWNRKVILVERVLNSHDPIIKEGKDDREKISKPKVGASKREVSKETKENVEVSKVKVSIGVTTSKEKVSIEDSNNNLKQKEVGRNMKQNMNQFKDVLET